MSASPMAPGAPGASTRPGVAGAGAPGARPCLALARAAAAGDEAAIAELYESRFSVVLAAARRSSSRDEHFCLDVVQETFLRVMRSGAALDRVRDDAHAERWLVAVTQSVTLDLLRAERRRQRREHAASRQEAAAGERAPDPIDTLARQLETLCREDRELLMLRSSGMTLNRIAEVAGATIGTVHGRLRRLTQSLRRDAERNPGDHT
jgi:RNA polymerase sigma factor (sigma-70 family)